MAVVTFVGHFYVEGELLIEHIVGAPAKPPGEGVTGADAIVGLFTKAVHVHTETHVGIGHDRSKLDGPKLNGRQHRHRVLMPQIKVAEPPFPHDAVAFPFEHHSH